MQNRFGVKDFFLFVLVAAVLVSVWLAISQADRQWTEIQTIKDQLGEQSNDIRRIQDRVSHGIAVGGPATTPGGSTDAAADDPFDRIETARAMKGYAQGDWLIWATQGNLAKITPLISTDLYAQWVYLEVLDTLATMDPQTLDWKPVLAKSWQISKDGLKITFQLRDGLQFSDGHPLTADDVVFSYDFIMNPKINCPREKAYYSRLKKVEKTATSEVAFVYSEPYFKSFEIAASMFILPKHFYGQFAPEEFNNSVGLLLGSGPYRLEDPKTWKPGQLVQLMRNERYWGVQPGFNRILFKEITNDKARLAAFRNGDIDFLWAYADQYREMLQDRSLVERTKHFEFDDPLGGYRFVAWNEVRDGKPTYFADKRVRQAMTMLLDRHRLIQEAMYGYASIASGPFWPKSKQYDPTIRPLPYDLDGAKRLLTEAGFTYDSSQSVLRGPDGKPFRFTLTYPSGNGTYDRMVLFMKDAYAKFGIVLEPQALEWGSFTDRLDNKNFDAITLGWSAVVEDDPYQSFHSSQAVPGGDDFVSYKNPELDKLIEEARRTMDEPARMKLWHRVHQVLNEDQPYTFLFFPYALRFLDGRIDNVQVIKLGLNPLEEWFVPLKAQKYRG